MVQHGDADRLGGIRRIRGREITGITQLSIVLELIVGVGNPDRSAMSRRYNNRRLLWVHIINFLSDKGHRRPANNATK